MNSGVGYRGGAPMGLSSGGPVYAAPSPEQMRNRNVLRLIDWIEHSVYFWLIFHFSGALLALVLTDHTNPEVESPLMRALWYPSYLMIIGLTLRRFPALLRTIVFNPLILMCVIVCGVSFFWSIAPHITMRRIVAIVMTTQFGFLLATRYDWRELVERLAWAYAALTIGSIIFAIILPEYGRMQMIHEGTWRGLWLEKNSFGAHMSKALLLMMCAFAMRPSRGWLYVPMGLLCFFAILMCTSKTALLAALLMIAGFVFVRVMRAHPILRIPVMYLSIVGSVAIAGAVIFFPEQAFGLIGKDPSLTGRTDIWDSLTRAIKERPLLGYGYGTFWADPLGPSYWTRFSLDWGVPTAHNGWVETWLSTGLVGVLMFSVLYLVTIILSLDRLARGGVENYWVLLSTILFGILSMSESTILQQNHIDWVIFVATAAKLFCGEPAFWRDGRPKMSYWRPLPAHKALA